MPRQGTVTIVVLMMLSVVSLLTQYMLQQARGYYSFNRFAIARLQAEQLARAGLAIAGAQLTLHRYELQNISSGQKADQESSEKSLLHAIRGALNQAQVVRLDAVRDGIEGTITWCICCEQGKFNINQAFDFTQKTFREPYRSIFGRLSFRLAGGGISAPGLVLEKITEFLAARGRPLEDISELMEVPELQGVLLDYEPPYESKKGGKSAAKVALRDLFTVWTETLALEPWLLSSTTAKVLGLRQTAFDDVHTRASLVSAAVGQFLPSLGRDWQESWPKVMQPLYEAPLPYPQMVSTLFEQQFAPFVFTVLSWGEVQGVSAKLLAVIRLAPQESSKASQTPPETKKHRDTTSQSWYTIEHILWA